MTGTEYSSQHGDPFGVFVIPRQRLQGNNYSRTLRIIATDGEGSGWEHVSVSLMNNPKACPSWEEMAMVKSLFWEPEDCVVEYHVGESNHISYGEVLHLWRYTKGEFPQPPLIFV